jgi:cytoskeletal protein RodZ
MANRNPQAASLASIGLKLKTAREKKGITIDQAQRQTHIHSTVLVALEAGRSDEVLTPTYVKSFLKKYSSYLGLNKDELISEYFTIHPELAQPDVSLGIKTDVIRQRVDMSGYIGMFGKMIVILMCLAVAVALVKVSIGFVKSHKAPRTTKTAAVAKQFKAPLAKQPQKKQDEKQQSSLQVVIPQNEQISLTMKVREQVYVGVKRDGVVLFKRLLPKGTTETFTADEKLDISIAKAKAVELVLNGRPLAPLSKGTIRDLEITRKSIKVK